MNNKNIFLVMLLACLVSFSETINAQTRIPGSGNSNSNNNNSQLEKKSLLSTRTTKNGKEITPIFIPYISGGFSGGSGNSIFAIGLTPVGGVAIDRFRIAAGPAFEYTRLRQGSFTDTYRTLGFLTFAEYNIIDIGGSSGIMGFGSGTKLYAHVEYAFNNIKHIETKQTVNISSLPVGAGFSQPMGGNTALYAVVLYDLLYGNTPYANNNNNSLNGLIYRFGIGIGF